MYIPEELKINKFHDVRIPSKGEYFNTGRYQSDTSKYGGEETAIDVRGTTKVDDTEALMQELERQEEEGK